MIFVIVFLMSSLLGTPNLVGKILNVQLANEVKLYFKKNIFQYCLVFALLTLLT